MAIWNKIAKSFPMLSKRSTIIAQFSKCRITISQNRRSFSMLSIFKMLSIFSGSRGPDGSDLPSRFGRKFQLSVQNDCFGNCHHKNTKSPNSFIRLALRLPKYVSARLLHEASGLPYVRERLITVGQNHLARMHANSLVEHTINSTRTNIAWDKYKTPISILKPPD